MQTLTLRALLAITCMTALLTGCGDKASDEDFSIVLRLSHVFSPKEELAIALETVAANVFEKTGGAVEILTYPNGQIAAYKDGVETVSYTHLTLPTMQ